MAKMSFVVSLSCLLLFACKSENAAPLTKEEIIKKYRITFGTPISMTATETQSLAVPFLRDGKYYISNYDGQILSDQAFDELVVKRNTPFVVGQIDGIYTLYDIKGEKLTEQSFDEIMDSNFDYEYSRVDSLTLQDIFVHHDLKDTIKAKFLAQDAYLKNALRIDKLKQKRFDSIKIRKQAFKEVKEELLFRNANFYDKIDRTSVAFFESPYTELVYVRDDETHGLIDMDGAWIYESEKRYLKKIPICCPDYNWQGIEIRDSDKSFTLNESFELVYQASCCAIIEKSDLDLTGIPDSTVIDSTLKDYKMSPMVQQYLILTNKEWSHIFHTDGSHHLSLRGAVTGQLSIGTDIHKVSMILKDSSSERLGYYVRLSDGFIYADNLENY